MKAPLAFAAMLALAACAMPGKEAPPKPFAGTKWQMVLEVPIPGEQPWIRMGDGRAEGFGGCNQFSARYLQDTVGARAIAFGAMSSSKRACEAGVVAVESRVLEVLHAASSYSIEGELMTMSGSGGTLRFKAIAEPAAK